MAGPVLLLAWPVAAQTVSYGRDVRPVLARKCFACHGPDSAERKARLRLDVPGQAAEVPVLEKITATDPDEVMPPPKSGKSLTAAETEVLRRWLAAGARYERHWSFVAPARPPLPATREPVTHPVDRFVQARLEAAGLRPAPAADRVTLARRLSLDLTGLPPTPEEADTFLADREPGAYERLVDRLLASPRYGERWARRWLDLARYADTNGYEKDRNRGIWPYRDWVIRACNADMPFDRFAVLQLAGDMLPEPTPDELVATGFHRNTMLNEEGGIDPLEFRFHAMTDRVHTTGTVFLGLTVGCAQCHAHKFDPIDHREYYGMMAFLDNADEPEYFVPDPEQDAGYAARLAEAQAAQDRLAEQWPGSAPPLEQRFAEWLDRHRRHASRWTGLRPVSATSNLPKLVAAADGTVDVFGDTTKHDVYRLRFAAVDHPVAAIRLEALPDDRLPDRGPGMTYYEGRKGDFFLSEFHLRKAGGPVTIAAATETHAGNKFGKNPVGARFCVDGDLQTGWSIDGQIGRRQVAVFALAAPVPAGEPLELEMHFGRHFTSSLGRFRLAATAELRGDASHTLGETLDALLSLADGELTGADRAELRSHFLLQAPELAREAERIRELRRPPPRTTTLILRERAPDNPRPTHRHHRGEFLQPRERVEPSVPAALHPFPAELPRNRLGFARWLVAPDNPLLARVVVNRHWAALFGTGIVATVDDFGVQGEAPSHPALLDWLAVEFVARGWSIKQLHRLLVTSAAYRRSSVVSPDQRRVDPANRLLARGPRFRLEAEVIRDGALCAAGLLSAKMYGPPVRPPQPAGVTEVAWGNPKWNASKGEDRFRRSVYTFAKRTAPFAFYRTFDAPSGESCAPRRDRSNTPLQALTLLNDPMMVEIARALGRRVAAETAGLGAEQAVRRGFRLVLTREPEPEELAALVRFQQSWQERFAADPAAARRIVGEADGPGGAPEAPASRAALVALARVLLGLDEAITRN